MFQTAPTGRAKCRGCGSAIGKGDLRFGDTFENPFADGATTTHWYHPRCAAFKRPEPVVAALAAAGEPVADAAALLRAAQAGVAHRRLPRIDGAERSPTGRAACRHCREKIVQDTWRVRLVFFEQGRFEPGGFLHAGCAAAYFETDDLAQRVVHFSGGLGAVERADLERALDTPASPA